jgi:hypothetical protein
MFSLSIALVQRHFDYSCFSWYAGISQALKNKLQVAQNKTVCFIKSMDPRTSIKQWELSSLRFLNVENREKQLRLNHTHTFMKNNFIKINEHHRNNTRSSRFNCNT